MAHTHTPSPYCSPTIFKSPFWFVDLSKTARSRIIDTTAIWPPALCLRLCHPHTTIKDNKTKARIHTHTLVTRTLTISLNKTKSRNFISCIEHWQKRSATSRMAARVWTRRTNYYKSMTNDDKSSVSNFLHSQAKNTRHFSLVSIILSNPGINLLMIRTTKCWIDTVVYSKTSSIRYTFNASIESLFTLTNFHMKVSIGQLLLWLLITIKCSAFFLSSMFFRRLRTISMFDHYLLFFTLNEWVALVSVRQLLHVVSSFFLYKLICHSAHTSIGFVGAAIFRVVHCHALSVRSMPPHRGEVNKFEE